MGGGRVTHTLIHGFRSLTRIPIKKKEWLHTPKSRKNPHIVLLILKFVNVRRFDLYFFWLDESIE